MKILFLNLVLLLLANATCSAQMPDYNIDSMMSLRKLDSIDGTVKTYYSPGNKPRAIKAQSLIEKAVTYYIEKYKKPFKVKLVILDSSQWVHDLAPWGANFFNNGWAIVNSGVSPESLFEFLVPKGKRRAFDSLLQKQKLTPDEYMFINDMVTVIHELGHHYIMKIRNIATSGMWFNEIGADYFTYNFFEKMKMSNYRQIIPFCQFSVDNVIPNYKEIIAWDTMNIKMPWDNFLWFDAHTQLLVENIYSAKGEAFLNEFIKTFEGKKPEDLELEYTLSIVNQLSGGIVIKWRNKMRTL